MFEKKQKTRPQSQTKPAQAVKEKANLPAAQKTPSNARLAKPAEKPKEKTQVKKPGKIAVWWNETLGEMRKVTWPTVPEARRMTGIVLLVMAGTALFFGILDWIFSRIIGLLINL